MTSAQVVKTSVTSNSSFKNYPHPDDHTVQTTDTLGFKPFTIKPKTVCNYGKMPFLCTGKRSSDWWLTNIGVVPYENFIKWAPFAC